MPTLHYLTSSKLKVFGDLHIVTLKSGLSEEVKAEENDKVQSMVETALADIEKRGDDAVRAMSKDFDKWDPTEFLLSDSEVEVCMKKLSLQEINDIKLAQEQVRNFAKIQRKALTDVEVETLPGVILDTKKYPTALVAMCPEGNTLW